jgi:hypothetical protein
MGAGPRPRPEYEVAFNRGLEALRTRDAGPLVALGAVPAGDRRYELPVLEGRYRIDLGAGTVARADDGGGIDVPMVWRILAVHYLAARRPDSTMTRWVSYAEFQDVREYEKVFRVRVVGRLCATAGRDRESFTAACARLGGQPIPGGDAGFRIQVFPRLAVVVTWYAADEEFPANVSFLLPDNALDCLPLEDLVVLSESVVSRLQGRPG